MKSKSKNLILIITIMMNIILIKKLTIIEEENPMPIIVNITVKQQ